MSLAWGNCTDLIKGQLFGQGKGGCVGNFVVCLRQGKTKVGTHEIKSGGVTGPECYHGDQRPFKQIVEKLEISSRDSEQYAI